MWFLILIAFQDVELMRPEPINAYLVLDKGDRIELTDIQVKGAEPYTFQFHSGRETSFVSLFRVARITKTKDPKIYRILYDDGSIQEGRVNSFALTGHPISELDKNVFYNIREIKRVHFISGNQLRSCLKGHYEAHTPFPYCPVCGNLLTIGPFPEEVANEEDALARDHLFRIDSRNQ